ncbi:arginine--tRNA ligase [Actinomadura luteofluorescens]|uniref:arginine--tRNA ligase n=1 Tax=Actinomadura luteofluorescens TaxID=46163 RepID=UPI003D9357D6
MNHERKGFTVTGLSPVPILTDRFRAALRNALGWEYAGTDPVLRRSRHADLQSNVALALARKLDRSPRSVARQIVKQLRVADLVSRVRISKRGYINLTLSEKWIAAQLQRFLDDERLAVPAAFSPQRVAVTLSAPSVGTVMNAGHLRPAIVGHALARILAFLGHEVIWENHIGDRGAPLGALIEHLLDFEEGIDAGLDVFTVDPDAFRRAAEAKFESDAEFAGRARRRLDALRAGDEETRRYRRLLVDASTAFHRPLYDRLGVPLTGDPRGEGFYDEYLPEVVDELVARGLAVDAGGALCVLLPGLTGEDGEPRAVIIRESDGGYGHTTIDLAAMLHRLDALRVQRVVHVAGGEEREHLETLFAVARRSGMAPGEVALDHAEIGPVIDPRTGHETVSGSVNSGRASDLMDRARRRAASVLRRKGRGKWLKGESRAAVRDALAIGAVKFTELLVRRDVGHPFDLDRMVGYSGRTAGFVQYTAVQLKSIFRRAKLAPESASGPIVIGTREERALALHLLGFGFTLEQAAAAAEPHRLARYLHDLAALCAAFYRACPVREAADEETRESRLALCAVTLRTLVTGLDLLGVPVPDRM